MIRHSKQRRKHITPKPPARIASFVTDYTPVTGGETPPENACYARVVFQQEVPVDGELRETDQVHTFTVPICDATTDTNEILHADTAQSDSLAHHENAPSDIINAHINTFKWPFRIRIAGVFITDGDYRE